MTIEQAAQGAGKALIRGGMLGAILCIAHSLYGLLLIEKERRELELNQFYQRNPGLFFDIGADGGETTSGGSNSSEPPEGQEDPVAARNRVLANPRATAMDVILGREPK